MISAQALIEALNEHLAAIVEEDVAIRASAGLRDKRAPAQVPVTIEMVEKAKAEAELNQIQENFDFSVFEDPEVRIVGVAHFKCPCGGTHVESTGKLSDYEVSGIKVKKGVVRVRYGLKKNTS